MMTQHCATSFKETCGVNAIVKKTVRRPKPLLHLVKPAAPPLTGGLELRREVDNLPADSLLLKQGAFRVFCAESRRIPHIMTEIGRLREVTFRAAGEGTGRALDLDHFDDYYRHLFIWNNETGEVVGAYRLGETDNILPKYGRHGLYTSTLFRYNGRFLDRIDPALELGRSFVRPEYQRSYQALLLLWKGIGAYVAHKPQYKLLFGPVSITRDYAPFSRQLMATYFQSANHRTDLSALVRPRKPFRAGRSSRVKARRAVDRMDDIRELSEAVARLESDGKGLPVLFKQYAKLGGASLAFNVDRAFSDVLDALMVVDLTETDRRILDKYMGPAQAAAFIDYHAIRQPACSA